jgi:acyl-coenzyme A synthetase/AMP-(fatty) acid ligase
MVSSIQISHMVNVAATKVLFCDNSTLLKLTGLEPETLKKLRIIYLSSKAPSPVQQQAISKIAEHSQVDILNSAELTETYEATSSDVAEDFASLMLFTSGSTGSPKGVRIHGSDIFNRIKAESEAYGLNGQDCMLNILPFSFDVGCNQLLTAICSGSKLALLNSWFAKDILAAIDKYAVTCISGVPSIWKSLLETDTQKVRDILAQLRYITLSGGDMSRTQRSTLRELMGERAKIFKTYGQTETFRSGMLKPDEYDEKPDSVGKPPPGVTVAILNPDGNLAAADEIGEIIHSGTGTMLGYAGEPEGGSNKLRDCPPAFVDGQKKVIFTGDRGKIDAQGYLYVLGRMDRMVKIRGNRVYPEEIEAQMLSHPDVFEAVTIYDSPSETLNAFYQTNENCELTTREIQKFLTSKLPNYMLPSKFHQVQQFQRTATGKVDFKETAKLINNLS